MAQRLIALLAVLVLSTQQVYCQDDDETAVNQQRTLVNLDIYYESLCPDSMNFINRQLVPSYPGLKDHLNINLVPFGKASWIDAEGSRPAQFTCQHGPNECRGNQAHSCALNEIAKAYDNPEDQQAKSVAVIGCVMAQGGTASVVHQCAEKHGLDRGVRTAINTCSNGNEGRKLLVKNGEKTFQLEKPLKFVPTIVINGEKNKDAFNNLVKAVCDQIPAAERPSACK